MEERNIYLKEVFAKNGFSLSEKQIEQFEIFYDMLIEKNKVMNLTAITEYKEVVVKHFLDSVFLAKYVDFSGTYSMIDVGTGAGFPGIPLKILFPDLEVVLLDSLNKRVNFLREVIEALHLQKITAIHGRAEEVVRKTEYRETFDFCVSRAVANMNSLSEICIPFVKIGGTFIPYKSMKGKEELKEASRAVKILGGSNSCIENKGEKDLIRFTIEEDYGGDEKLERNFIIIHKVKNTPKKYPRKPGTPFKEPLK